jgi:large subunit ribosomal protein L33
MAKPTSILIKMVSSADTGFYYVTRKNPRTKTEKMELKKYDPGRAQACRLQGIEDEVTFRQECSNGPAALSGGFFVAGLPDGLLCRQTAVQVANIPTARRRFAAVRQATKTGRIRQDGQSHEILYRRRLGRPGRHEDGPGGQSGHRGAHV